MGFDVQNGVSGAINGVEQPVKTSTKKETTTTEGAE